MCYSTDDDARLAMELQRNELISRKKERIQREAEDMVCNHILFRFCTSDISTVFN